MEHKVRLQISKHQTLVLMKYSIEDPFDYSTDLKHYEVKISPNNLSSYHLP